MPETPRSERLNFVVVLTDDQGRWAMPHRMPELVMPNLADLLDDSLELNQFYCASPVCSPARASLLTGRMPSAHGVHDWLVGDPDQRPDCYLDGQPTTPELLAEAGYECGMVGKWHLGDSRRPAPGFEYWYAHRFGGGPYFNAPIWRDGLPAEEPEYFTEAVTDHAVEFIRNHDRSRPFYLQVNYTAPHDPWLNAHPARYLDRYQDCDFPSVPREQPHPWAAARSADFAGAFADPAAHIAGYCAALTGVDTGLARIREALAAAGASQSTVLVYTSDNGFSCGHGGVWGKGNGTWPLNMWDNAVRVPFVIHVPGGPRGVSEALLSATSLHPTLCDLAGVAPAPDDLSAGASFAPLLRGQNHKTSEVVVVLGEYGGARMITDGRWKYIGRFAGPEELYDLASDPGEKCNLLNVSAAAGELARLRTTLAQWFAEHQRAEATAYHRNISGHGQLQPVWRGGDDRSTYAPAPADVK